MFCDGKRVFSMIKDDNGHALMWKKKSILWELPYWEALEVRNAIDVMHLIKTLCVNVLGFLVLVVREKIHSKQDAT